jgi:hypothetical protein
MRDTATAAYYDELVQGLSDLQSSGVAAIQLINLAWGPITFQSPTTAQATTVETWRTTFSDGSVLQGPDTNIYTLVQEGGVWKIQSDEHPDARRQQPPPTSPSAQATPSAGPTPVLPSGSSGQDQSRNWAGYAATGGTFTAISATWTIPTVGTGTQPAADATWIGIGGVDTTDLIQAGTDATVQGGQVAYTAWIEMLPRASQPVALPVGPGDSVSVSIAQQSDGTWQIVIKNVTSGQTYQTSVTYTSCRCSAEWIEEAPAVGRRSLLPLDDFGSVQFTAATTVKDGQQISIAQANGRPITMTNTAGQALAQPSSLGSDGASFTVTRTSVPPSRSRPTGDVAPAALPS